MSQYTAGLIYVVQLIVEQCEDIRLIQSTK